MILKKKLVLLSNLVFTKYKNKNKDMNALTGG
jgi:hypothetical protein